MIRRLLLVAGLWLAGALAGVATARAEIPVPPPTGYVVDLAKAMPAERAAALEARLKALEARKGSQVVVVVVPTTGDESIEQFSLRVAEAWKPGRKKVDDGVVLVVATADRAVRIEVGYGLEGALNDATAHRIIDEYILPRFRAGDLAGGIEAGVDRVAAVIDGEPLPPPPARGPAGQEDNGGTPSYLPILFMVTLAMAAILPAILGRLGGSVATGGVVAAVAWWLGGLSIALLAGFLAALFTLGGGIGLLAMLSGGHRRGFGGGGGLGGGGGGGFGGGGGGFGGGGASGRW